VTHVQSSILDHVDPYGSEFQQNPFPFYTAMREASPAWHLPGTVLYFITRFDLVAQVLKDTVTFSSAFGATAAEPPKPHIVEQIDAIKRQGWTRPATMLTVDPPDHTRYRGTVAKAFNARTIAALRPAIEVIVDEELNRFAHEPVVDFKTAFSTPVPVRVIMHALDLAPGREDDIKRWSDDATAGIGRKLPDDRAVECAHGVVELQRYMNSEVVARQDDLRDDVISALLRAEFPTPDGGVRPLTIEELMGIFQQLLGAGNETTTKLFSQMLRNLADNHDEWWKLKADPTRAAAVVDEALRLSSPTQGMFRVVMRDVDLDGAHIPAGARAMVMFAAANRDPAVFPDPDRFDPDRPNVRSHLAFGAGVHFCIGAPLSRLESVIALEYLVRKWHDFRLTEANTFEYEPSFMLRGLTNLFVEWEPAH
jgi:cytochrome P450